MVCGRYIYITIVTIVFMGIISWFINIKQLTSLGGPCRILKRIVSPLISTNPLAQGTQEGPEQWQARGTSGAVSDVIIKRMCFLLEGYVFFRFLTFFSVDCFFCFPVWLLWLWDSWLLWIVFSCWLLLILASWLFCFLALCCNQCADKEYNIN